MDVESLQTHKRPSGRCLDVFLVISVVVLFAVVGAVTAGGIMMLTELQAKVEKPQAYRQAGETAYKEKTFAFLRPTESKLRNSTMKMTPVAYSEGNSIGNLFTFNSEQHSLLTKLEGSYFVYLELNLTCKVGCKVGVLTVSLGNFLKCSVHLHVPALSALSNEVTKKCWTVAKINANQRFLTKMTVSHGEVRELEHWSLDLNHSSLGMFLVD